MGRGARNYSKQGNPEWALRHDLACRHGRRGVGYKGKASWAKCYPGACLEGGTRDVRFALRMFVSATMKVVGVLLRFSRECFFESSMFFKVGSDTVARCS